MTECGSSMQAQMLIRVNEYVQAQRKAYTTLSIDEQRRRGPLLLEDLLNLVIHYLHEEVDGSEGDSEDDGHTVSDGAGRGSDVRQPRARLRAAPRNRPLKLLTSSTSSLPFALRDVPALASVASLQMRLTTMVMAAISTRAIVTLYELEEWACAQEGVGHFVELGLGTGLHVLPIVQDYFHLRPNSLVFPVRAHDVITFLLNDMTAREMLLYGGGDTRDLLYRFSAFYERHVLAGGASPSSTAARRGQGKLGNVRQLGIHVQDYAAFLALLSQELTNAHRVEHQHYQRWMERCVATATADPRRPNAEQTGTGAAESDGSVGEGGLVRDASFEIASRWERNQGLYERVLRSLDAACAHAELVESMRRTRERSLCRRLGCDEDAVQRVTTSGTRVMRFAVTATEAEARLYSIPLSLWRTSPLGDEASTTLAGSSEGRGGVELCFHVGDSTSRRECRTLHEPAHGNNAAPTPGAVSHVYQWHASAESPQGKHPEKHTDNDVTMGTKPPSSSVIRRRRGIIVCDAPSIVPQEALNATAAATTLPKTQQVGAEGAGSLLASLLAPAGSLGLAEPRNGNLADAPLTASLRGNDAAVDGVERVGGTESVTADVAGSPREITTEPATAVERLCDILTQSRDSELKAIHTPAPVSAASTASRARDTWLSRVVDVFEAFKVGDVVPVKLLCNAWATCAGCPRPAARTKSSNFSSERGTATNEYTQRRCIPLFHPFAGASSSGVISSTAPVSRLASLRQQLNASFPGAAPPNTHATPAGSCASTVEETKEVVYMATPAEVCWLSWWGSASSDAPNSPTAVLLTCSCLDRHYPSTLRNIFCELLGVRAAPTVAAWCTAAAMCARRLLAPEALTPSFVEVYMESFERCVNADVAARAAEECEGATPTPSPPVSLSAELPFLQRQQKTAQVALHRMLLDVQESLWTTSPWRAEVFPCDHSWRCGIDGLLYATPQWCSYDGVLLTASPSSPSARTSVVGYLAKAEGTSSAGAAPPLRVVCFRAHEPSWAVCGVLHYFGVRPLSQLTETRVSLHTTVATDASGALHDKIAAIVPYVQAFCRAFFPLWYGVVYVQLRERLRRLRVVLTAIASTSALGTSTAPLQTHRLQLGGHVYAYGRHIGLAYVEAHNIIYGAAEVTSVPTLAEGLLPLFMPVGMWDETDARRLRDVVIRLLGALSSLDSSVEWSDGANTSPQQQQWRREQIGRVLQPVAARYGLTLLTLTSDATSPASSGVSAPEEVMEGGAAHQHVDAEAPFTLPSRASIRYMSNYPPGTDALRQPRGLQQASTGHRPGQASGIETLSEKGVRELVAHAKPFTQRNCGDGRLRVTVPLDGRTVTVTSMPAWQGFPLNLDLDALVLKSIVTTTPEGSRRGGGGGGGAAAAAVRDPQDGVCDDDDSTAWVSGGDEDHESFLTFQYRPGRGLRGNRGALESRKRTRVCSGDVREHAGAKLSHDIVGPDMASAAMWLRPPAAPAMSGSGGDTPGYAVAAERYVYELLQEEYIKQVQHDGVRVIWVNEHGEAGSPFDILVIKPRRLNSQTCRGSGSDSGQWDVVQYVEVKSTCTPSRQEFEMSMAEILLAARFGTSYCIYRVFGASTDALRRMRHRVYADIVRLWYTAQLTITSDIRVTPST